MLLHRYLKNPIKETWVLDILKEQKIKVSRLSDFNDPFEGKFAVPSEVSPAEVTSYMKAELTNPHSPSYDPWKRPAPIHIRDFRQRYPEKSKEIMKEWESARDSFTYIASFSDPQKIKPGDEILLWSHYAHSHRGVRVEFDIPETSTKSHALHRVEYQSERVKIRLADLSAGKEPELLWKAFRRKCDAWSYEQEVRLLVEPEHCEIKPCGDNDLFFYPIELAWIRGLDFGAECDLTVQQPIVDYVKAQNLPIQLRRAKYHSLEFSLEYENLN